MKKVLILITIIMMDLLSGMEFDLIVPSFPEIKAHYALSPFWVEALLSSNFIGYCAGLFLVGSLADRHGRKPMLLIGIGLFISGSFLCLYSSSYTGLLVGRLLQGFGVAAPSILSFLIIADSYPLEQQSKLIALLNGVMNISVGIAPILGCYITNEFHWQGNFVALASLSLLVWLMTLVFIPYQRVSPKERPAIMAGYLRLIKSKPLLLLIVHIIFECAPYWIFVGMSPLLYLEAFKVSLAHFGYYQGAYALIFALGSFAFGWGLKFLDSKTWLRLSFGIFFFGFLTLFWVTVVNSTSPLLITLAFMPFVIGQIIPSTILYPLCLNFSKEEKGQIAAMIQGGRLIFCAVILQISGFYYQGTFQNIGFVMLAVIGAVLVTLTLVIRNLAVFTRH